MNRRQKIIVSVTGIFLVLLLLVGLTYAYFLTNITGNNKDKSISVSTANLAVVYGGDDSSIIGEGETIIPGKTFEPKTFTVTNNGNATTDYVVVIEILDGTSTFESNDFTYTLTCESGCDGVETATTFPISGGILVGNNIDVGETQTYSFTLTYEETGKNQTNDMNKKLEAKINIKDISTINPYSDNKDSLAFNIINNSTSGKTGTKLVGAPETQVAKEISKTTGTGKYEEKTVSISVGHVALWGSGDTKEEAETSSNYLESLEGVKNKYVYNMMDGWTKYLISYDSTTRKGLFLSEEEINEYEQELSVTQDDLGVSYYYRGNVEDNYVNFAGMCWRIVRIAGDGSIKLILEDKNTTCDNSSYTGNWIIGDGNFGYDNQTTNSSGTIIGMINYLEPVTNADKSMVKAFYDFQTSLSSKISTTYSGKTINDILKSGDWCYNDTAYPDRTIDYKTAIPLTENEKITKYTNNESFMYDSAVRLALVTTKIPTLKCNGTKMSEFKSVTYNNTEIIKESPMYVSGLTADEIVYAGGRSGEANSNYYLLKLNSGFYSISPYAGLADEGFIAMIYTVVDDLAFGVGNLNYNPATYSHNYRPVISLKNNVLLNDGTGTINDPYTIK